MDNFKNNMVENKIFGLHEIDSEIMLWLGVHGYGLQQHLKAIGIPPNPEVSGLFSTLRSYIDYASQAAQAHIDLLSKLQHKKITLVTDNRIPRLSCRYRRSIHGPTEGISTIEFLLDHKPVLHLRFMCLEYEKQPSLFVTAMQRYTDENLSIISDPPKHSLNYFLNTILSVLIGEGMSLKDVDPARFCAYQKESKLIERFENSTNSKLHHLVLGTAMALAKANSYKQFFLTTYDNQLWVKTHRKKGHKTQIPDIYDSTATYFAMNNSKQLPGFWHIDGRDGGITLPTNSSARNNIVVMSVAQRAYQQFLSYN
jgi:hypothetical protein